MNYEINKPRSKKFIRNRKKKAKSDRWINHCICVGDRAGKIDMILTKSIIPENTWTDLGKPISYSEAKSRVAQVKNIMCANHMAAYGIARQYSSIALELPHKIKEGYYYHYHINKNQRNDLHIWFYGKNTISWEKVTN